MTKQSSRIFKLCKLADFLDKKGLYRKAEQINLIITDRYDALGMPHPDPKTMCKGQCEGIGWVPIRKDDMEEPYHTLWLDAEHQEATDDDWHFVVCPICGGTGKKTGKEVEIAIPKDFHSDSNNSHHCFKRHCPLCGDDSTCRCGTSKMLINEVCYECENTELGEV